MSSPDAEGYYRVYEQMCRALKAIVSEGAKGPLVDRLRDAMPDEATAMLLTLALRSVELPMWFDQQLNSALCRTGMRHATVVGKPWLLDPSAVIEDGARVALAVRLRDLLDLVDAETAPILELRRRR